jgi:RNA polymerase sigma factor (sigma-70 family)
VRGDEDQARFAAVFLPHLAQAHRLARWLTGSASDAEDVVQDAALKALRGIAGFSGANARAWVLTIVRNAANTWLAKNRVAPVVLAADFDRPDQHAAVDDVPDPDTPETLLLRKVEADEVRRAVSALPDVFREVIVLREIHELNYREIAQVVGVPMGTVMSRLARARRMLIDSLGDAR